MKTALIFLLLLTIAPLTSLPVVDYRTENPEVDDIYSVVNLSETGLKRVPFDLAVKGLKNLELKGRIKNPDILTIADYSQSSNNKRLYIIDLKNRKLLFNTYVAHGRNTGTEFAKYFSNIEGSLKSSLGFYITTNPVNGSHTGFSLLLEGVEKGINDHASKREIIIHGADYATEGFIKKYGRLGRSMGCPALPPEMTKQIIEKIKDGTCLFIYNSDNEYISSSDLLH